MRLYAAPAMFPFCMMNLYGESAGSGFPGCETMSAVVVWLGRCVMIVDVIKSRRRLLLWCPDDHLMAMGVLTPLVALSVTGKRCSVRLNLKCPFIESFFVA